MFSEYCDKAAQLAVKYAIDVKPGNTVDIRGSEISADLMRAIYSEVLKAGGYPHLSIGLSGTQELYFRFANADQLQWADPVFRTIVEQYDAIINIEDDYNPKKLQLVDPEKLRIRQSSPQIVDILKTYQDREAKGDLRWTIIPFPCHALAQEAGMDLYSYEEFVSTTLKLNTSNPVAEWLRLHEHQEKIVQILNQVDQIHVIGEDTDLRLSVKERKWVNCSGQKNLPDGEVFTGPIEDSINGTIRFTFPGIFEGKEIEDIALEFREGKVVKATAGKGQDLLDSILKIEGADHVGEFAIGTNYGVTKFTKNMLFDEKMGGTMHMALGLGFPETGSKNFSAIHWDILKDMRTPQSQIFADGKIIYEEGQWKI